MAILPDALHSGAQKVFFVFLVVVLFSFVLFGFFAVFFHSRSGSLHFALLCQSDRSDFWLLLLLLSCWRFAFSFCSIASLRTIVV